MNEILLRRKNKVILGTGTARVANDRYITAIMKNIEELGYTFSREDMLRYKERWIRIGERIHPSEFECSRHILEYDKAICAFDNLRNNKKIETFGNKVELALAYGE